MPSRTSREFVGPRNFLLLALVAMLLAWPLAALAEIRVEAFSGNPLGVGRIVVDVSPEAATAATNDDRTTVTDSAGRVLYPVVEPSRERKILRSLLGVELPRRVTFYFLFHGEDRLDLELYLPDRVQVTVTPHHDQRGYDELLNEWWKGYVAMYSRVHRDADYPIGVQTYLTAMWAGRLAQPMPRLEGFLVREQEQGGTVVGKLMADEAYRASVLRDLMLGELDSQAATLPLPSVTLPVTDVLPPGLAGKIAIEPMASHVPDDCYYVRFGTFANYLWFKDFLGRWQGDLGNMLIQRSIVRSSSEQISSMLALSESKVSKILGPQVIDDVALIGFDPYFADGASVGVLFHAKNNFLLGTSFNQQRSAAAKAVEGAKNEELDIAGHKVAYLSSPDGALRSYYATDGNFHLVTSSRRMVERFYEAAAGNGQLSTAPDFLAARMVYPVDRDDRVFVHLSSAFLKNLLSPAYRIELDRRLRSLETERGLELARLAAAQEKLPGETEQQLAAGALLPNGFSQRADGASWRVDEAGRKVESVRGYRGHFVPIADNVPELVSESELRRYEQFLADLRGEVGNLVPVTAVIHRDELQPGIEQISVDLLLQRYSTTNLASWAKKLGPPSNLRVAPIAGDLASANIVLDGMLGGGEPFHLFGGIRDGAIPITIAGGTLEVPLQLTAAIEAYVGAWPKPLFLERLLGRPAGPYDANGMARTTGLFDLWVRRADDFMLFSFKERVLFDVGTQLAMVEAARPAQAWFQLQDIMGTQYEAVATAFAYARTRDTSASGSRFMNSLVRQLHVEPSAAHDLANELVGGEFVCPLGGEYRLDEVPGGLEVWTSTAAAPNNQFLLTEVPADYRFPLLEWFRGMSAELVRGEDSLTLSAEVFISAERPAPGEFHTPLAPKVPASPQPPTPAAPSAPTSAEELPPPTPQPPRTP